MEIRDDGMDGGCSLIEKCPDGGLGIIYLGAKRKRNGMVFG
jgi:hypothetical protein